MGRGKFIFCMLIFLLTLNGCGNKNEVMNYEDADENIITITFFGNKYEPENVTVIEEIISDFMQENPDIRVSYESLKGTDYYDALEKRMDTGNGNDVFMVNHDIVLKLQEKGQLADLSELETISNYTERMRSQMVEDDKIYWVPTTVSVFGLYCNVDLLAKYGQEIPKNLGEWEQTCDYFVQQGVTPIIVNNDISLKTLAIGLGFYDVYQENRQQEVFARLNCGEELLSTYLRAGFSLAEDFIQKGYIDAEKALNTQKTSDDLQEFVKGETPFMMTGAWAAGRVAEMQPRFSFEVVPYPALETGSFLVMNPDTRLSVNANSQHVDAAMKFVEFFTQEKNIQKFTDQQSSFSPLEGGAPSSVKEIQPLIPCYRANQTVIGTDNMLAIPIWNLTAEVSQKLLAGDNVASVMDWMDEQFVQERITLP